MEIALKREAVADRISEAEKDIHGYFREYGAAELGAGYDRLGKLLIEAGDYNHAFDQFYHAYELNKESECFKRAMYNAHAKRTLWKKYLKDLEDEDRAIARVANVWNASRTSFTRLDEDKHIMYSFKPNVTFSYPQSSQNYEMCVTALSDYSSPEWVWLKKQLDGIAHIASRYGIKMVIVMFPLKWQLGEGEKYRRPHELMKRYCRLKKISLVDLLPRYEREEATSIYVVEDDDVHPSAIGHLIAGEEIFRQIGTPDLLLRVRLLENK